MSDPLLQQKKEQSEVFAPERQAEQVKSTQQSATELRQNFASGQSPLMEKLGRQQEYRRLMRAVGAEPVKEQIPAVREVRSIEPIPDPPMAEKAQKKQYLSKKSGAGSRGDKAQ